MPARGADSSGVGNQCLLAFGRLLQALRMTVRRRRSGWTVKQVEHGSRRHRKDRSRVYLVRAMGYHWDIRHGLARWAAVAARSNDPAWVTLLEDQSWERRAAVCMSTERRSIEKVTSQGITFKGASHMASPAQPTPTKGFGGAPLAAELRTRSLRISEAARTVRRIRLSVIRARYFWDGVRES